jgi:2-haloacid dehalogenase
MSIRNIIFDLGGVLIDWNPRYVYRSIFDTEEEVEWFLNKICTMDWNEQQDRGRSLEEGTRILQEKYPKWRDQIAAFYGRWVEMLGGPIEENVKLIRKLKEENQYNLFALTNWSAETFPIAEDRYDFLQLFQGIVVSGKEKVIKPESEIYHLLLNRYGLQAKECLFIDDNKRNILAALKQGIKSIHYTQPTDLSIALKELDII